MSLLEKDTTKKKRVDENTIKLDAGDDSGEYEVEVIWDSAVYAKEVDEYLLRLYYMLEWKRHPKEKNNWKPVSAVMHLRKLVNTFHKDHLKKPTTTSTVLDLAPPMARPIVKPTKLLKQKRGRPAKRCAMKRIKWSNKESIQVSLFFLSQMPADSQRSVFLMDRWGAYI